jgi:hypothetical protein
VTHVLPPLALPIYARLAVVPRARDVGGSLSLPAVVGIPRLSSANLSLARVLRQKNHQSKLQSADGQWKNDGGIKERKHA